MTQLDQHFLLLFSTVLLFRFTLAEKVRRVIIVFVRWSDSNSNRFSHLPSLGLADGCGTRQRLSSTATSRRAFLGLASPPSNVRVTPPQTTSVESRCCRRPRPLFYSSSANHAPNSARSTLHVDRVLATIETHLPAPASD